METVIRAFTDTDLYKLTMGQAVLNHYPDLKVDYEFVNRGNTGFPLEFAVKLQEAIAQMASLRLTGEEKTFLESSCPYFTSQYLKWLSEYRFNPNEVQVVQQGHNLYIKISGLWNRTILWEVPLMAAISELYFQMTNQNPNIDWLDKTRCKGKDFRQAGANIIDFGTRRRYSFDVHRQVVELLLETSGRVNEGGVLVGTSNPLLAMEYGLRPIGTFAHEWVMVHSALFGHKDATRKALEVWWNEFKGQLGIALTDTYGTEEFLRSFGRDLANRYSGVRQDSGDPLEVMDKIVRHYVELGIDPKTKTFVASDSLYTQKVISILAYAKERIRCLFGIGTFFTNDVGVTPLNMVIKLFRVILPTGLVVPVIKLSDTRGKVTGDLRAIEDARLAFPYLNL